MIISQVSYRTNGPLVIDVKSCLWLLVVVADLFFPDALLSFFK